MFKINRVLLLCIVIGVLLSTCCAKRKSKKKQSLLLRQKETNAIDFIRLAVMRLIYGVATRIGLGEQISEALNGAFIPPGADDYDYNGFNILDREEDYDYR